MEVDKDKILKSLDDLIESTELDKIYPEDTVQELKENLKMIRNFCEVWWED